MAKRVFYGAIATWTAIAKGTPITQSQYMAILGASATQVTDILEIEMSGTSSASTVACWTFARTGALQTGAITGLASPNSDGPMNPATAALGAAVSTFIASATNGPTPSSAATDATLNFAMNAFGGILRWNASPTQQWTLSGSALGAGESVLWNQNVNSAGTPSGIAQLLYETY